MTTVLVAQLDLDHFPQGTELKDVLDVAAVTTKRAEYDDVWISIFTTKSVQQKLNSLCDQLNVKLSNALLSSKFVNADQGISLLGGAIAYSYDHDKLVIYNCNKDEIVSEFDFSDAASRQDGAFARFRRLDAVHRERNLSQIIDQLEGLLATSEAASSSAADTLRWLARPLVNYMKTYKALLLTLVPEKPFGAKYGEYDALRRFNFSGDVDRLIYMETKLQGELSKLDFVRSSKGFFHFGTNSMSVLRRRHFPENISREEMSAILGWWSSYYIAAGREFARLSFNSVAILHFCRAFETYVLSYLWSRGHVMVGESSQFVLTSGKDLGLLGLWETIGEEAPGFKKQFRDRFHKMRRCRNANLMIHGFHVPDASMVTKVGTLVNEMVTEWENRLTRRSRLIRGPLFPIFRYETWDGNLGRTLATAIVDRSRAP